MNGVSSRPSELGDLVVLLIDVLFMLEASPAVCDYSLPIPHADKVGNKAIQFKHSCSFLVLTDPCLAEMDEVSLEQGGVNLEVLHVWLKSGNVEGSYPSLASTVQSPLSRIVVERSG